MEKLQQFLKKLAMPTITGEDLIFSSLSVYRYASWFLTSVFYVATTPGQHLLFKFGVLLSLLCAAIVTQRLYRASWGNHRALGTVTIIEAFGIALVLSPTGGLESPFVWYAINPIFVAATGLSLRWSLGVVLAVIAIITGTMLQLVERISLTGGSTSRVNLDWMLIFLLVSLAAQTLAFLVRTINSRNEKLRQQGQELARALQMRAALHNLIEQLSAAEHPVEIASVAVEASLKLLDAQSAVFYGAGESLSEKGNGFALSEWARAGAPLRDQEREWLQQVVHCRQEQPAMLAGTNIAGCAAGEAIRTRLLIPLTAATSYYGVIAVFFASHRIDVSSHMARSISELTAAALDRSRLQEINHKLLIRSEQQRIAGELHDSVAQQLFNISAASYALSLKWQTMEQSAVEDQLRNITLTAQRAARELRTSIYGLRYPNGSGAGFVDVIRDYLSQLEQMHGITVKFTADCMPLYLDGLSVGLRRVLFRVLSEACGNALHHGRSTALQVILRMTSDYCSLKVVDNGCGFDTSRLTDGDGQVSSSAGLGLANMSRMATIFGGTCRVFSEPGKGTAVEFQIPHLIGQQLGRQVQEVWG